MDSGDRLPRWVVVWLVASMVIVAWDVAFVLARQNNMVPVTVH